MTQQVRDRVKQLIARELGVDVERVTDDALLVPEHTKLGGLLSSDRSHLAADSLDIVSLVMTLEDEFDILISDDEAEALNEATVKDCCDLVDSKRDAKAA
jgi:acyl carrier protein